MAIKLISSFEGVFNIYNTSLALSVGRYTAIQFVLVQVNTNYTLFFIVTHVFLKKKHLY